MTELKKEFLSLWSSSDFAREMLSPSETLSYLLEAENIPLEKFSDVELDEKTRLSVLEKAGRVINGEPLQYVCSFAYFYRSRFFVKEGVLIPRSDSEILVETAVKEIPKNTHFLDLCTGSGCLALSILQDREDLTATLVDISDTALDVAQHNADFLGLADRCTFLKFDVLKDDFSRLTDHSAIIMNPPYITGEEMKKLPKNVMHEPRLALFGGEDGLDFYTRLSNTAKPETLLIFEIGAEQKNALLCLFGKGEVIKDYSGHDRVFLKKQEF